MFSGIVLGVGRVLAREPRDQGERLIVDLGGLAGDVAVGQSIAINGACLTAVLRDGERVAFDLAGETLRRTNLGGLSVGQAVNVEHALRLGDRLDGHLVQGHVDGTGRIARLAPSGDDWWLDVAAERELLAQLVFKGSVAVDGISLTVAELRDDGFACTIIPHTRNLTNLGERSEGDRVNLEVDMVGKWVRRIVGESLPRSS